MQNMLSKIRLLFCAVIAFVSNSSLFSQIDLTITLAVRDTNINTFGMNYLDISFSLLDSNSNIETRLGYEILQIQKQNNDWVEIPSEAPYMVGRDNFKMPVFAEVEQYLDLFPLFVKHPEDFRYLWEQGGEINLRFGLYIVNANPSGRYVFSNVVVLTIPPLDSTNNIAFAYLLQKSTETPELQNFTSVFWGQATSDIMPVYEYLYQNFPNLLFGQISRAMLALGKCGDYNFEALPANVKDEVQQTYDDLSLSTIPPVKRVLEYLQECLEN